MSIRRKLVSDTAVLFSTSLVAQFIGFLVIPLFIKNLGAEMYGLYAISGVLMGYVGLFDFGLTRGLTREIGHSYSEGDYKRMSLAIYGGTFFLILVGLVSGAAIYFGRDLFIAWINVPEADIATARELLTVTAAFSVVAWPAKLPLGILQGNQEIKASSFIEAYKSIATSAALLLGVIYTRDLALIRSVTCIAMISTLIPYIWFIYKRIPLLRTELSARELRSLKPVMSYGVKYFYSQLLALISTKLDAFIIANMVNLAAVAAYQVVFKIQFMVVMITQNIFGAFLPAVYRFSNIENRANLQRLLDEALRYRALIMAPLISILIAVSPAFIALWIGEDFRQYGIWAQLYLLAHFTWIFGLGATVIRASDHITSANRIALIRTILNIVLSIWLVQYYGLGGPVLGTVISSLILGDMVCFPFYCYKTGLKWRTCFGNALKIIFATIPITLILLLSQVFLPIGHWFTLIIYVGVGGCLMALVLGLFFLRKKDVETLRVLLQRKANIPV